MKIYPQVTTRRDRNGLHYLWHRGARLNAGAFNRARLAKAEAKGRSNGT